MHTGDGGPAGRLTVSNLAWRSEDLPRALALLSRLGVAGVEVAPGRIAPWEAQTPERLREYRARVEDAGLCVSSLQAIYYGREGVRLLGTEPQFAALCEHTRTVGDTAAALGANLAVFGAPAVRTRGALAEGAAFELGAQRLVSLARVASAAGLVIGLEPVPEFYGGNFLVRADDVIRMVWSVRSPAIRVHLDTGCARLAGDDIANAIAAAGGLLCHMHAAEPELRGFGAPEADHRSAAAALERAGYGGWIAIEMRETTLDEVERAVRLVRSIYFRR